jgi:hypothetical protein
MFNWFGPDKDTYPSYPRPSNIKADAVYNIGIDKQGRVQLTLNGEITSATLTMNDDGVRQLIRLLEATLIEEAEEENV